MKIGPGTLLNNRYKLENQIGKGGMATVWKAYDQTLGRHVAVKLLSPEYATVADSAKRFKQEASAAATLSSPYIVNVYDWGQEGIAPYIVMELVSGQNLKEIINENGRMPQKNVAKLAKQVGQALSVAHSQDIIHRDIKPQNIIVQPDGSVKVADFGISHARNSSDSKTGMVLGTVQYVSPEQAQGLELTQCSDIYSLGVVMYEALTGTLPFNGKDTTEIALKHVEKQPIPPSRIVPNVDPMLEDIIMKALRKRPADRYASIQEMILDLEAFITGKRNFSESETKIMHPVSAEGEKIKMSANNSNLADSNSKKNKTKNIIIAVALILALLGTCVGVIYALTHQTSIVPDITLQTAEKAQEELNSVGLLVGEITFENSDEIDEGLIIRTDPEANTEIKKGEKVNIIVSSGVEKIAVPNLYNLSESEAITKLNELGLSHNKNISKHSEDVAEGRIMEQSPSAGEMVMPGDMVVFTLSAGKNDIDIPDLSNMTEEEAMTSLRNAQLVGLVSSRQSSDTVEEGRVISQNPSPGMKIQPGSQVTFTLSTGIADVVVPYLIGLTESGANSALLNAQLVLGTVTEEFSTEAKGSVISQSVAATTSAKKGSSVNIVISKGEEPKPEPEPEPEPDPEPEPATPSNSSSQHESSSSNQATNTQRPQQNSTSSSSNNSNNNNVTVEPLTGN